MKIPADWTVIEVSRRYPETRPVLQKYRVDLCCGGQHPLRMVAEKHGVDLEALLRELNDAITAGSP